MLPLYEAKMIHHFDYRWATYEPDGTTRLVTADEKADPTFVVMPRYWVDEGLVDERLEGRWNGDWLLGWRDICRSTDERTMIASTFPRTAVGHTMPIAFHTGPTPSLQAAWTSYVFDYVARQKVGGTHMTYGYLEQLPVPAPRAFADSATCPAEWVESRVTALTSPFRHRDRSTLRAELDAAFFHLYGIERDDVDYIMDTFPIVKRKDEAEFGEYRTKSLVLAIYDAMAQAQASGQPYQSPTGIDSHDLEELPR